MNQIILLETESISQVLYLFHNRYAFEICDIFDESWSLEELGFF